MSILERMRRSTDSATMRIIFGVMMMIFIFWGAGKTGRTAKQSSVLAVIGGQSITTTQLYREMRVRNLGNNGSSEEESKRIQNQLLEQMIQEELLVQEATRLGIEVSSEEITRQIVYTKTFEKDGKHNRELYLRQLKRLGMTEEHHRDEIRRQLMVEKLQQVVLWGAHVSDAEVKDAYDKQNTLVDLSWVKIPESALLDDVKVQDSDVDAYLANSEVKVKERYDKDYDRLYKVPRKAEFSAILVRSDIKGTDPEALRTKVYDLRKRAADLDDAGFAELAREYSEDLSAVNGGDMGNMPEPLMDPPLASAIFAAGAGKVTEVAETGRGYWIARVRAVQEAKELAFDDVKRDIARQIVAQQGVGKLTQDYAERLLAGWKAAGTAPVDVLAEQGLKVEDTGPTALGSLTIPGVGPEAGLEQAVETAHAVGVLPGVYPMSGGWAVAAITAWTPADPSGFDQQKDAMRARVLAQARSEYLQAWFEDLKKRVNVERPMNLDGSSS